MSKERCREWLYYTSKPYGKMMECGNVLPCADHPTADPSEPSQEEALEKVLCDECARLYVDPRTAVMLRMPSREGSITFYFCSLECASNCAYECASEVG